MGITSNDIAAQRAMIERGDEKRKADWKQAERERLRDTFAAAALTGWLASQQTVISQKEMATRAYDYADAMLRERERHHIPDAGKMVENTTNHDAVPEAKAFPSESSVPLGNGGGCGGTDKPVTLPAMGTGNLSEAEIDALEFVVEEGRIASMDDYGILRSLLVRVRPEWESQSYEKNDEKRTNAAMNRDATPSEGSVQGEGTITDAEREAVEDAVAELTPGPIADTLRSLLERLAWFFFCENMTLRYGEKRET